MPKQELELPTASDLMRLVDELHAGRDVGDLIEAAEQRHQTGAHYALRVYAASCLDRGDPLGAQLQAFVVRYLRSR